MRLREEVLFVRRCAGWGDLRPSAEDATVYMSRWSYGRKAPIPYRAALFGGRTLFCPKRAAAIGSALKSVACLAILRAPVFVWDGRKRPSSKDADVVRSLTALSPRQLNAPASTAHPTTTSSVFWMISKTAFRRGYFL
jgi:hypothetical protein